MARANATEFTADVSINSGTLYGFSISAGAAAGVVTIHDGTDNTGPALAELDILSGDSKHQSCEVAAATGNIFVDVVSGANVRGVIWHG